MEERFKVVRVTGEHLDDSSVPELPFRLHIVQSPPAAWKFDPKMRELKIDEVVVLGVSREVLEGLLQRMGCVASPRYMNHSITGPAKQRRRNGAARKRS
jgi:hypothetical protein